MEGIQISVYYIGAQEDIALIQLGGYLDTVTSPQLENALEDVTTEGYCHVICDLGNVNYISSAGWGIFVSRIKMIRDMGGDLVLSQMIPDVFDVFKLLEFDRILKFYDTTEKAVKEFDDIRGLVSPVSESGNGDSYIDGERSIGDEKRLSLLRRGTDVGSDYPRSPLSSTSGGSFDFSRGDSTPDNGRKSNDLVNSEPSVFPYVARDNNVLDRDLPLNEKIKLAVVENPLAGVNVIRKVLNSSRFGYMNVGYFKVRKVFKELDLDTKEKRYRFWRSR